MRGLVAHVSQSAVTVADQGGGAAEAGFAADWRAVRADDAIQFAELPPVPPPETPAWLDALQRFFGRLFGPVADLLVALGPAIKWGLLALGIAAAAFIVWRLTRDIRLPEARAAEEEWIPARAAALALLEDADRLAAQGRFDEATHLLLQRSVGHIREARPHWLDPSTTAREIAAAPSLPERARAAFGAIGSRVERSLFALKPLAEPDWRAARSAYEDFALADLSDGRA